jgi:hypothetical protein
MDGSLEMLLENFFYSLTPVVMRTVLEPEALKTLFETQLESLKSSFSEGQERLVDIRQTPTHLFAIVKSSDRSIKVNIDQALEALKISATEQAISYIFFHDVHYFGFIYRNDDPLKQWQYSQALRKVVTGSPRVNQLEAKSSLAFK